MKMQKDRRTPEEIELDAKVALRVEALKDQLWSDDIDEVVSAQGEFDDMDCG